MMFFHLSLLVHLYDLQHHQSLSETMFHLQAKQLHASFVHAHFHLNDAADVIIDHIEAQCLHPCITFTKLSLYKKLLDMTLHPHHHLPDLKNLRLPSCQTLSTPMSTKLHQMIPMLARTSPLRFFLLHAAKVRSSCEEGPGQSALQSAYHNPKLDVTELKQNRTPYCSGQKLQSNKLTKQKPIKPTP